MLVSISKLQKANLPESVETLDRNMVYFTEDGGIYIASSKGVRKCGVDDETQTIIDSLVSADSVSVDEFTAMMTDIMGVII